MYRPINEQDEFLLNRLLDEDLPAEEAAALRTRLEREPELRSAYAAMTRIDTLLIARRADQPQVDWSRFHREVMDQVEAEAVRPIRIRLANYLRVALPLAAAAAIGLLVWYWPDGGAGLPQPKDPGRQPQYVRVDPPGVADDIQVAYHRTESTEASDTISVSFARSDELSREYQIEDEKSRGRKPSDSFVAKAKVPAQPPSSGVLAAVMASVE